MRKLGDFIKESMINESDKEIRFTPGDLENAKETIDSLKSLAQKNGIYVETVDGGIKFKGTPDNKEKFGSILDVMQQFVEKIQNGSSAEENADAIKKAADQVSKLSDWMDEEDPEENEGE